VEGAHEPKECELDQETLIRRLPILLIRLHEGTYGGEELGWGTAGCQGFVGLCDSLGLLKEDTRAWVLDDQEVSGKGR
jgi:hypothetical protein